MILKSFSKLISYSTKAPKDERKLGNGKEGGGKQQTEKEKDVGYRELQGEVSEKEVEDEGMER